MNSKSSYHTRIKLRIAELRSIISQAQAELNELEVAERVLERLADSGAANQSPQDMGEENSPRPAREATVADMAVNALLEHGAMNSSDLLAYLQRTWRSDLAQTTLSSTLSRSKNEGRVIYRDGLWSAPTQNSGLIDKENSAPGSSLGGQSPGADVFG